MTYTILRRNIGLTWLAVLVAFAAPTIQAQSGPAGLSPTFAKDVAPILQNNCQQCHRPDQSTPMSLLTYQEVRPYARAIRAKVLSREMPPWGIDPTVGTQAFENKMALTVAEIATITDWVEAGAPFGEALDLPAPREFAEDHVWSLPGQPDLVVASTPHLVKGGSGQTWAEVFVDIPLTEERWVKAYQSKPGKDDVAIVHHMMATVILPDGTDDGFGFHYTPGKPATVYQDDAGFLLRPGSQIRFDLHFDAEDDDIVAKPQLGLILYPKGYEPTYQVDRLNFASLSELDIPAGEVTRHDGYTLMRENFRVMTFMPHFHVLGKRQCLELIYPDTGETEMLNCADFDFYWQTVFRYEQDAQPLIPKGTILHTINYHDNTLANRLNPDPKNWTGFGQRSTDEMAIAMFEGIKLTDEEFQQAREGRLRQLEAQD